MSNQKKNVHGEGNYEATRRYLEDQKKYQETHDVKKAARRAREAIEGEEGEELREAEKKGKSRKKSPDA